MGNLPKHIHKSFGQIMKFVLSLILSFFLFAFITKLPLAFSDDVEQVVDVNGEPIFPGGKYYIRPLVRGPPGGGLFLSKTGDLKCPVTVLQSYREVENGIPVKFSIPGISPGIIFTGTSLLFVLVKMYFWLSLCQYLQLLFFYFLFYTSTPHMFIFHEFGINNFFNCTFNP